MIKYFFSFLIIISLKSYSQWVSQNSGLSNSLAIRSISIPNANVVWASTINKTIGAPDKYFTRTTDAGLNWKSAKVQAITGIGITNITAVDDSTAWVCYIGNHNGYVYRTTDGGVNWYKQNNPAALTEPDFIYFWNKLEGIVFFDPIQQMQNSTFFVYKTWDGGNTWTDISSQSTGLTCLGSINEYGFVNCFTVYKDTIWTVTSRGDVLKSTDRGYTWKRNTNYYYLFVNGAKIAFRDANNGLIAVRGSASLSSNIPFQFFRTTNGGQTWTLLNSTGAIFNSDITNIPGTNNYVCVGGETGLTGSSISYDDGLTWVALETLTNAPPKTSVKFFNSTLGWAGGISSSVTDGGIYKWSGQVGIESKNKSAVEISLYPNPTKDIVSIQMNNTYNKHISLIITNLLGETVYKSKSEYNTLFFTKHIDMSQYASGIYNLTLFDGIDIKTSKIIKD